MATIRVRMLMLAAIGCCFLTGSASAMTHIVGGAFGWRAPENNKTSFYADWAFPRTFGVGDQLGKCIYVLLLFPRLIFLEDYYYRSLEEA